MALGWDLTYGGMALTLRNFERALITVSSSPHERRP
jgi:hypothetical protein